MYTFPPMMVANSQKHHCRVRPYTREVLVISTNLDIQKNHYPLDFTNRKGIEARIKNTWYNQGLFGSSLIEGCLEMDLIECLFVEVAIKAASTIPVSAATTTTTVITNDEITLAKALAELKSAKLPTTTAATTITAVSTRPRAKGLVIHEQEQAPTPTVSSQQPSQLNVQDKGKGKMVEPEPVKKLSKKDQLMLDEELAFKLQAEEEEEERLAREKAQQIEEANIVSWDNVQAMIDADYQMAQQMQAEEQEKLSIKKKSELFVQLLEARKKHFAAIRAK
ncbi:hypothetical protein Tco_1448527 [Tanacetum coccineum]